MTTQTPTLGKNRTGVATAKRLAKEMIEATSEFEPSSQGNDRGIAEVRRRYVADVEPVGSVPLPSPKGLLKTAVQALKGEKPVQLMDKLGERLAFERTGARLYQALLSKYDAAVSSDLLPDRSELERILREELAHFQALHAAIVKLGGDPTAVTPSANLHATLTKGFVSVVADPRTTFVECLEAALLAELADNEGWDALLELVQGTGDSALIAQFETAAMDEERHLESVRNWIAKAQGRDMTEDEDVLIP
jgi:rubrerythrin